MQEFWSTNDDVQTRQNKFLKSEPEEIALTATCIYISRGRPEKLLICNPSPDTWNSWMFPYGSQKMPSTPDLTLSGRSYFEVEDAVARLSSGETEFHKRLSKLGEMSGHPTGIQFQTLYTSFEFKTSKSSGLRTLYVFEYLIAKVDHEFEPAVEGVWVRADGYSSTRNEIDALAEKRDMAVEGNVFDALKIAMG
ncbi:hypothetical protein DEM25_017390 [Oceaniradius stylonematis]|uniref:Uncharacterized protein n=2 Tax=Oceaniradius stylonematis TaxID=2184161 RepID=A0A3A8A511_9HYPH|nr:hypothetical protein DEM25_017390 [Oceaniradius stylonematis]